MTVSHSDLANAIRFLSMDAVERAQSGHPGMPMGMADVAAILFSKFLKFDAGAPNWPDRDRFVLSAGHGSMLLYSLTFLLGYEGMTIDDLKNFRQLGSKTAGHPEVGHAPGVETTTGPLGQGLATAVGMAIAERHLNAKFGDDLVDHKTYVIAGDGCLMEGLSQEALTLSGHLKLSKLTVLWDDNSISIDGPISLTDSTEQLERFEASNWSVLRIDGHDPAQIERALNRAGQHDMPTLIACRTTIGKGAPSKQGTAATHGAPLGADEIAAAREMLGWPHEPFEIPTEILSAWRALGRRFEMERRNWEFRLRDSDSSLYKGFRQATELPAALSDAIEVYIGGLIDSPPCIATRKASQNVLEVINSVLDATVGGSADLTGSNNTKTSQLDVLSAENYGGRYIHYGIREHGMAAAMNGLALHGGIIPYGGAFLVFSDYCRASIRLSALMNLRVIYVMTHDSIGLGEDGPTHQPVEHLAALRAIPNLQVFRPGDAIETAECWQAALESEGPSVLALSRQSLAPFRLESADDNLCARGAYEVVGSEMTAAVRLFASGSEVSIALDAARELTDLGHTTRVISVPCWERFAKQPDAYRRAVIGQAKVRVAVEAGVEQGWLRFIGEDGLFIGMESFGASGPCKEVYEHFGITAQNIVNLVLERVDTSEATPAIESVD